MKRKALVRFLICVMSPMLCAGCGGTNVSTDAEVHENAEESSDEADEEKTIKESGSLEMDVTSDKNIAEGETAANQDTEPEENPYDGGPDWVTLADQFILPTSQMCIEDAVTKYAITLVDGGKYHDYEGDIGDVIPEYKDKDLDGDHKPDVIKREGQHYVFELSRKGTFKTDDYSSSPNEGEVIQFEDLGCRNFDEIEVVHYTFGTGGPMVWDTAVYSYQDGEWRKFPVIDEDGVINSTQLQGLIAKETGKPYEAGSVRVADVHMQYLLLDFGRKDGADQTYDYRTSYLYMNFFPEYLKEGDYECSGLNTDSGLIYSWPYEVSGDPVDLKGDMQRKLNTYLSNFSEQGYEDKEWPYTYAHFVLEWCRINDPASVRFSNDRYGVDREKMFEILGRFFGTNFEEGDYSDLGVNNPYNGTVEYESDTTWYYEPAADGEMFKYNAFSVVSDAQEINGQYNKKFLRLPFKIYRLPEEEYELNGIDKSYYSLSAVEAEKLENEGKLIYAADGLAFIEKVEDGYWLINYSVFD